MLSNFTRSQIKIFILNGNIKKNQSILKDASYKVKQGEEYTLMQNIPKNEKFEGENIPLDIIYEDTDVIIVNKSAGIVTHPAPGNANGTLVNALINYAKN